MGKVENIKKEKFTGEQAIELINTLKLSQGFYGRIAEKLEDTEVRKEFIEEVNSKNFTDSVDFILWLEC